MRRCALTITLVACLCSCSKSPTEPEAPPLTIEWSYDSLNEWICVVSAKITLVDPDKWEWDDGNVGIAYNLAMVDDAGVFTDRKQDVVSSYASSFYVGWELSGIMPWESMYFTYDVRLVGPPNFSKQLGTTLEGTHRFEPPE